MLFEEIQQNALASWEALVKSKEPRIYINTATCGRSAGTMQVRECILSELAKRKVEARIIEVGGNGMCYLEPIISIVKRGMTQIYYGNVNAEVAAQLVEDYLLHDNPRADLALCTAGEGELAGVPRISELPFFKSQVRIALHNCGQIDPCDIQHYIANKGYSGLNNALAMSPDAVINEIERSGLRGHGGAGFPTGIKWRSCRNESDDEKYFICNANEGDPTSFANRLLLESDPHSVLEGMLIGAYAIGADLGYIYLNSKYDLAKTRLITALQQMKGKGLIGNHILGSQFNFQIEIRQGAGAFVCGEETSLIGSIEGKRGVPFSRPPFPSQSGLYGKPTIINNVETLAHVSRVFQEGSQWYADFNSGNVKGTKIFTLTGEISRSGVIEVPLGMTVHQIIDGIGGGVPEDRQLKAVLVGGPVGGFLPADSLDIAIDYGDLSGAGAIIGSGSIVAIDENSCMVDLSQYLVSFSKAESCGFCVFGREGTMQMLEILTDITQGDGKPGDIDLLLQLGEGLKMGSFCGLGKMAPNPVLTSISHFRNEYIAHINRKRCPSKVCKALISFHIMPDRCGGCTICIQHCPVNAIAGGDNLIHVVDQQSCTKCGICFDVCPSQYRAIVKASGRPPQTPEQPIPVGSWRNT